MNILTEHKNYVHCFETCGKAIYINFCMRVSQAIHKQFSLMIGQNDVLWYDITLIPAICHFKCSVGQVDLH